MYENYTNEDLQNERRRIKQQIWRHECSNDSYCLSPQYREDHSILHAVDSEIERRQNEKSSSEIFDDIWSGFKQARF